MENALNLMLQEYIENYNIDLPQEIRKNIKLGLQIEHHTFSGVVKIGEHGLKGVTSAGLKLILDALRWIEDRYLQARNYEKLEIGDIYNGATLAWGEDGKSAFIIIYRIKGFNKDGTAYMDLTKYWYLQNIDAGSIPVDDDPLDEVTPNDQTDDKNWEIYFSEKTIVPISKISFIDISPNNSTTLLQGQRVEFISNVDYTLNFSKEETEYLGTISIDIYGDNGNGTFDQLLSRTTKIVTETPADQNGKMNHGRQTISQTITIPSGVTSLKLFAKLFDASTINEKSQSIYIAFSKNYIIKSKASNTTSGPLTHNETWGPGEILLTGDIIVPEGITLTILPNTTIKIATTSDYPRDENDPYPNKISINIHGELVAVGTTSSKIRFLTNATSPTVGDWHDIVFWENATGAISDAVIQDAILGVAVSGRSSVNVDASYVSKCETGLQATDETGVEFKDNQIEDCVVGIGIFDNTWADIERNVLSNMKDPDPNKDGHGLVITGVTQADIRQNTIRFCERGAYVSSSSSVDIVDNSFENNTDIGLGIGGEAIPLVQANTFNGNVWAIYLWSNSNPQIRGNTIVNSSENGVTYSSSHTPNPVFTENNVHDNAWNVVNFSPSNKTAENNWWGTTNESTIKTGIWDKEDNSELGVVDFIPFATTPFPGDIPGGDIPVNLDQLVTCEYVNETTYTPINIKSNFTAADTKITTYAKFSAAKGTHTALAKWFRPDGNLYYQWSQNYDFASLMIPHFWSFIYTSYLTNYQRQWKVEIYWDNQLKGSINFTYSQGNVTAAVVFSGEIGGGKTTLNEDSSRSRPMPENENGRAAHRVKLSAQP